jgi:hypothetical protein
MRLIRSRSGLRNKAAKIDKAISVCICKVLETKRSVEEPELSGAASFQAGGVSGFFYCADSSSL